MARTDGPMRPESGVHGRALHGAAAGRAGRHARDWPSCVATSAVPPAAPSSEMLQAAQFAGFLASLQQLVQGSPGRTGRGAGRRARRLRPGTPGAGGVALCAGAGRARHTRRAIRCRRRSCCAKSLARPGTAHRRRARLRRGRTAARRCRAAADGGKSRAWWKKRSASVRDRTPARPPLPSPDGCRPSRKRPRNCAGSWKRPRPSWMRLPTSSAAMPIAPPPTKDAHREPARHPQSPHPGGRRRSGPAAPADHPAARREL